MRYTPIYLLLLVTTINCSSSQNSRDKPLILCTTSIMEDWVRNIAGDDFEVKVLLDKGIDPHTYKPSITDLDAIQSADIIIYHGIHLEGKIIDVLERIQGKLIIDAAAKLPETKIINDPNFQASKDPHYWFDTDLVNLVVSYIGEELSKAYPEKTSKLLENVQLYQQSISRTADSVTAIINTIPESNRLVITTHDALSYWARKFDMRVNTLQGASTVSQFGLKEVTELVNFICDENIPTIFLENIISSQAMESVQSGCKARGCQVMLGPELLSDSLGREENQDTYLEMLLYNANLLARYLK